ncbi:MAG: transporter, partial [Sandaracinaceae bacterium]|nr:transporter [Sandaracinaceae bacterium]
MRSLLLALLLPLHLVAVASAQAPLGEFSVMRFTPAVGARNYFAVEGATVPGHLAPTVGLTLDYGHTPLILWNANCGMAGSNCSLEDQRREIVSYVFAGHITGSIALFDRLQIGAVLPLALTSGQAFTPPASPMGLPGGDGFAIADPRLHVKGNILSDSSSGISLGASAFVTFPTGQAIAPDRYLGERLPTFGGSVLFEMVRSGFHVAANAGAVWRDGDQLFSTYSGSQLTYAAALGYDITPLVGVFGEVVGASSFSDNVDEHGLEWRAGGHLRVGDFDFDLAGGTALIAGAGTPLFRIVGGMRWAPVRIDSDGDGVVDGQDACPSDSEDGDDWEDDDGCPELDNDEDGHPDAEDPCPDDAEDMDGTQDEDGCPDTDNDGDGIHDGFDSCPNEPE